MRIVVTGSSGLIGRGAVEACRERWPNAVILEIDLALHLDCREFFACDLEGADVVFHCAAITGGIEGTTGNAAIQSSTNIELDGAYFQWAIRTRPGRMLYISSSCAYPMQPPGTIQNLVESDIDLEHINGHPDNAYGWAKLTGEVIARKVREIGIPVTTVRPFAVYGTDQATCRMIPMFVQRALSDSSVFDVWGPGDQASDFIHVDDAVGAILEMMDQNIDGPVNLGTGRGTTVDEAAAMVMEAANISRPIVHDLTKPVGPRWRVADTTLLENFYTPKISLEEGVQRAVVAGSK